MSKTYTWVADGKEETGTLKQFAKRRFYSGSAGCSTPEDVKFSCEGIRGNCYGRAEDLKTGEIVEVK